MVVSAHLEFKNPFVDLLQFLWKQNNHDGFCFHNLKTGLRFLESVHFSQLVVWTFFPPTYFEESW